MNLPKKIFILFVSAFSMHQIAMGQAPAVRWQNCLGGSGYDEVTSIQQSDDDGYVAALGSFDFRVVKLTVGGVIDWQRNYGGPAEDVVYSIKTIPDKGYIMTGYTKSVSGDVTGNHGGSDMWVVRISLTGDLLWQKCYGGTGDEQGRYISLDPNGGFIIAGLTTSYDGDVLGRTAKTTAPDCDVWVVKIDDTGNIVWQRSYGGSMSDAANCIRPTQDNGYILIGDTYSNDGDVKHFHNSADTTADMWAIKLTSAGDTVWERALGGSDEESGTSIQQTWDGGYIAGGITRSTDGDVKGLNGDDDGWVVKLTATGKIEWQKCIGGNNGDGIYEVDVTPDGWYIAAGVEGSTNVSGNHGGYDFWITKMVDTGSILWHRCMGGTNHDYGACMTQSKDKGYVMGGWTMSNDGDVHGNHGGHFDAWVVKMEPDTLKTPAAGVINMQSKEAVLIYPTYTNGPVTIENGENYSYVITDLNGKLLNKGVITKPEQEINISTYAGGMYILQLRNNSANVNCKLVKY